MRDEHTDRTGYIIAAVDFLVLAVFVLVYVGMLLGGIPGLALDRSGIALLGAIVLIAAGRLTSQQALDAIDVPTMALLLGLMIVSAQLRLGGFYARVSRWLAERQTAPEALLALLITAGALLSAVLVNDVVCLAMTPVLLDGLQARRLNPLPFLLALAASANIGSALTLIGNPQNMLIGQVLGLHFGGYLLQALLPVALSLGLLWLILCRLYRGRWDAGDESMALVAEHREQPFDRWQSIKGLLAISLLVLAFLLSPWPREVLALAAAGWLLCSRRMASREMLGQVDWQLLVLFAGLFIVNHSFQQTGLTAQAIAGLQAIGADPHQPAWLFVFSALLSNLVSNVPAVILLLPAASGPLAAPLAGPILALSSTLAGNLLVVGSIANIIVVEQAARRGLRISWNEHARTGIPVTIVSLLLAGLWLWLLGSAL